MKTRRVMYVGIVLFFALMFMVPSVMAATGEVTWTNPPENAGKIKRNDDGDEQDYTYNTNADDTNPPDYVPSVGDHVTFTPGPGMTASDVTLDPAGAPGDDPDGTPGDDPADPPGEEPDTEIILPFGLSKNGKTPHGWVVSFEQAGDNFPDDCHIKGPPAPPVPTPYPIMGVCK